MLYLIFVSKDIRLLSNVDLVNYLSGPENRGREFFILHVYISYNSKQNCLTLGSFFISCDVEWNH